MRERRSISIADQIFEQLERDILSGKYPRGEILSELRLSEELGVSRTPIREAIRRLEQEHVVEESGRGVVVVGITREDMLDMYEIRLRIEGLAAERAAERISAEDLAEMREATDLQRFYVERQGNQNSDEIKNLDSRFHDRLYRASGSKELYNMLSSLHKKMTKFRMASVSERSRALLSVEEHEAILDALGRRDPEAARLAVEAHVANARDRMKSMEV